MNELLKKAKANLLNNSYGRYDLVEKIITLEKLLNDKPRQIIKELIDLLDIKDDDLKYNSFITWLWRLREKNKNKKISSTSIIEDTNKIENWKKFTPTKPKAIANNNTVLKQVQYTSEDN